MSKEAFEIAKKMRLEQSPGYRNWCKKHNINPDTARSIEA